MSGSGAHGPVHVRVLDAAGVRDALDEIVRLFTLHGAAVISAGNAASRTLFDRFGFRPEHDYVWYHTEFGGPGEP